MNEFVSNANAQTLMSAVGNKIKDTKITATANSEDIALTDSTDARVHDLRIYGKTENGHSVGENGLTVTACGGYNLWDEQWELGTYNQDTGEKEAASSLIRSTNAISVNPEKTYYITAVGEPSTTRMMVLYYSKTEFIKALAVPVNASFDVPINCYYIRFRMQRTYGATYKHNITINVYNSNINGNYYPYKNLTLPISTALPLKGSAKTIDLGSIDWLYQSEGVEGDPASFPRFSSYSYKPSDAYVPSIEFGVAMSSCSSRYTPAVDPVLGGNTDKTICLGLSKAIFIVDHDYTDPAEFKAAVTGITLTYPSYCDEIDLADGVAITRLDTNGDVLATPVTTPLSDAEKAAFAEFRTFDGNTNVTATDDPFMSMTYVKNSSNGKALANVDDRIKETDISGKVDKVAGKGLSTEDYTTAEKTKLASLSPITISSTLTLTVAGWDSQTKQQTVLTTIDTTKRNVVDITVSELPTWSECNVYAISESATGVTFQCDTIPEDALTFKITSMAVTSNA